MILSFDRGNPIAIVRGGRYNGKIINLYDPTEKCCKKCSTKCRKAGIKCCIDCKGGNCGRRANEADIKQDPFDIISQDFINKHNKKRMTKGELAKIRKMLIEETEEGDESLEKLCNAIIIESTKKQMKEFTVHDDGVIIPFPKFTTAERHYIAGPSGSGKSYFISKFLSEYKKINPVSKIYLISDVDEDEVLDKLNVIRIDINSLVDGSDPIKPDDLRDSIVIFDDIDSIRDKEISKEVCSLRDSLLRRGRHENINVIVTYHLLTNYKDTRIILNEVHSITIFPRSGSTYGITRLLKYYVGLDKNQIQKIFSLPTRSVTIYKHYPMYVIYDHGIYLL